MTTSFEAWLCSNFTDVLIAYLVVVAWFTVALVAMLRGERSGRMPYATWQGIWSELNRPLWGSPIPRAAIHRDINIGNWRKR